MRDNLTVGRTEFTPYNDNFDKIQETLKDYTKIIIETDSGKPVIIAEIKNNCVDVADGYRVRLTPKYDKN